ncbi:MAG: agmatinase [Halobacteriaceae archaeon]
MLPGAAADRGGAAYAVVGAPLDRSATFRPGARFGPDEVRRAARGFEDYHHEFDSRFSELGVHDAGDVHAWDDAREYLDFLAGELRDARDAGAVPAVVGGEHTVSVAGVEATDPETFVALDAHLDLREEYDGDPYSHATVTRHALRTADRAVVVGARSGSEAEWERAGADDVTVVPPGVVDSWEPAVGGPVYLSVDLDAADPGFAPGTGTPEPFGLDPAAMRRVVRALAPRAVGFDVVEITDRDDGQTATLAAKLLREFVFAHATG